MKNSDSVLHLNNKKKIDQNILNLTYSDHLLKSDSGYQINKQSGSI